MPHLAALTEATYTPFEQSVIRLVAETLDRSPRGLDVTADLQEIGYNSIHLLELSLYVVEEFSVEISNAEFATVLTIMDLCQLIARKKDFGPEAFSFIADSQSQKRHPLRGFERGILLRGDGSPGDKISVQDASNKLSVLASGAMFAHGGVVVATSEDAPQWLALLNRLEIPSKICAGRSIGQFLDSQDKTVFICVIDVREPIRPRSAALHLNWVSTLCQRLEQLEKSGRSPAIIFHDCISYIPCNYIKNLVGAVRYTALLYIVSELDEEVSINSFISTGHDNREDLAWLKENLKTRSMEVAY